MSSKKPHTDMKKTIQLFAIAILMVSASALNANAVLVTINHEQQNSETREVAHFDGIASSGSFNIMVKMSDQESLKLEGNQEDLDKIETVVENGTLKIRTKKKNGDNWNWNFTGKVNVYINAKELNALAMNGSGKIKVEGKMNADQISLKINGSGKIDTDISASKANFALNGSGILSVNGTVEDLNMMISGSGTIQAKDVKANDLNVKIAGSGNVTVGVQNNLNAVIAGSGSVRYSGSPEVKISKAGSGSVSKMK